MLIVGDTKVIRAANTTRHGEIVAPLDSPLLGGGLAFPPKYTRSRFKLYELLRRYSAVPLVHELRPSDPFSKSGIAS